MPREEKKALCYGCWCCCGVLAEVEDGKVVRLKGDPDHFINKGFFCDRGARFIEHLYHPDRLNYPLRRTHGRGEGKWERISWERALDEIAEKLSKLREKYGPETLASTGGTGRGHQETFKERFLHLFGSPNHANAGQFCHVNYRLIHYAIYGADIAGMRKSGANVEADQGCIVLWGHHPKESIPIEHHFYLQSKRKGKVKFIVIDPKRTESVDELADCWVPLRPGTDAALALGWLHILIKEGLYDRSFVEEWCHGFSALQERVQEYPPERVARITWVPEEKIIESARMFGSSKPSHIAWGVKTDMQGVNVGSAIHAIGILRAITGSLQMPGGPTLHGPCQKVHGGVHFNYIDQLAPEQRRKQLGIEKYKLWTFPGWEMVSEAMRPYWNNHMTSSYMPSCHIADIWQAILTERPYPVKALITGGNNPLIAYANTRQTYQALKSPHLELYVVLEQWMTPSAMLADYVLPVTNWLEMPVMHLSTYAGFQDFVACGEQVVPPLYERRPDFYFYQGLGKRLGQGDFWKDSLEKEWTYCLQPLLQELKMSSYEEFSREKGWWHPPLQLNFYADIDPQTQRAKGFATPTGKIEFYSKILERLGYNPLPQYEEPAESPLRRPELLKEFPLILITGSRFRPYHHSEHRQLRSARRIYPEPRVEIHADTAGELGIQDGDWTIIESPRGKIKQRAKLTTRIHPQMVDAQHGWWFPEEIPDDPVLFRAFESNVNVLTPNGDDSCDGLTGAFNLSPLLCRIYPAKKYF